MNNAPGTCPSSERRRGTSVSSLSSRERDVIGGIVRGLTNKKIGIELGISHRTVEIHRARPMRKLDLTTLAALIAKALAERDKLLGAHRVQRPKATTGKACEILST